MLRKRLLVSNLLDAAANNVYATCFAIVAVMNLKFSATQIGFMNAAGSCSFLLLAIPIGSWVDRTGAVKALRVAYAAKMVALSITTVTFGLGYLSFPAALTLEFLVGVVTLGSENAQAASTAFLEGDEAVSHTISRMASVDTAAQIALPGLVGLTVAYLGGTTLFAVAALWSTAAVVYFLNADDVSPAAAKEETKPTTSALAGFKVMSGDPLLWTSVIVVAVGNIGLAIGDSVDSLLVLRHLKLGAPFYGLTSAVSALAGFAASLLAPRVVARFAPRHIFRGGALLQSCVAALPLLAFEIPQVSRGILLCFSVLWSAVLVMTNIAGFSYLARSVDRSILGRTVAARRTVTMGAVPFAALGGGVLADWGGIAVPLIVWPTITAAAALVFFAYGVSRELEAD